MSTIAEVTGSYAVGQGTSSTTVSWGSGRLSANTGNLLLAFTHSVFGSGAGSATQTISGWTQVTFATNNTFSGASRCALFYKFATSSDTGSVTYTPTLLTYTVASATGNGTTQTYTTSGSGSTQPFVTGQLVTVTGLTPSGYNVSGATITAVGGSSGAWTFSVAGSTTGASSGTGSVTYSSVSRVGMMLMEFSGVNATTPLDQGAVSATTNGVGATSLTVLNSATSHVNGGALGMIFTGMINTIGGTNAVFAISPPTSLTNVQHYYNNTISLLGAYTSFYDTTITETSSATTGWTTSRAGSGIYIALRPSTYQQTGQTIAGSEVVADSTAPSTTDTQTAGSIVAAETVADSTAPSTTDTQTAGSIVAAETVADSTAPTTTDSQPGAAITSIVGDTNTSTSTSTPTTGSLAATAATSGSQTSSTPRNGNTVAAIAGASGSQTSGASPSGSISLVGAFSGQATGSVTATAATLLSTVELGHPTATYTQPLKPGSVRGRAVPAGSVAGGTATASVTCRTKWSSVVCDWEVKL